MRELEEARRRYRYDVNTAHSVGHREGRIEGRTEGDMLRLIRQIGKKLIKNKSIKTIADELEEDIAVIESPDGTESPFYVYSLKLPQITLREFLCYSTDGLPFTKERISFFG